MPLNIPQDAVNPPANRRKALLWSAVLVILLVVAVPVYLILQNLLTGIYKPNYTEVYRLVNEKVSQSAVIAVHLPKKMDVLTAQAAVKFEPEIEGSWIKSSSETELAFKPKSQLTLGHHYEVTLTDNEIGKIREDFLVAPDPEIIAIFPKGDSEAPENSEVTIVFNRPMVPLSTLGYIEDNYQVPVKIIPETKGKFKWTSTNNLQFIPETTLIASADYEVKVNDGFTSMDGLAVKATSQKFTTRKLRYLSYSQGDIIYNQPISLYFNLPVDLEKTKGEIVLRDETTGQDVAFIAQYHSKSEDNKKVSEAPIEKHIAQNDAIGTLIYNTASLFNLNFNIFDKNSDEKVNKSIIEIYNSKDKFGRKKIWDFDHKYSVKVKKASPIAGNIAITEEISLAVNVKGPINSITEKSSRSQYAAPDFFDPKGTLYVSFYEEVDLGKSKIDVPKAKEIKFAEKCSDENLNILTSPDCQRETDKKKIEITFKDGELSVGEFFNITFNKIVNTSGLTINKDAISQKISVYPKFSISKTVPNAGMQGGSVEKLIICSTTPIAAEAKEDWRKIIKANADYDIHGWGISQKITDLNIKYLKDCQINEFRTEITYGLMPTTDYTISGSIADAFEQKNDLSINFRTGEIPNDTVSIFSLQSDHSVTSPDKTKLAFAAKNVEYVNVSICKISAYSFLSYLGRYDGLSITDSPSAISGCENTANDKIALPKKYWINNYFNIDIKKYFPEGIGNYIVTVSHPKFTTSQWSSKIKGYTYSTAYPKTYLSVTNLSIAEKRISPRSQYLTSEVLGLAKEEADKIKNIYWVTNISDLQPVGGAEIKLYSRDKDNKITPAGSYATGSDGVAMTNIYSDPFGVIVTKGKDSAVISWNRDNLDWASDAATAKSVYIYTNKPIYRPGQEVDFRGIYRLGYDGNYQIDNSAPLKITIRNAKFDVILEKEVSVSDFGTFESKFTIDQNAGLGQYSICALEYSCVYVDVEEYAPSSFEVKAESDKEEYISKDTANLNISANYYFGVPVENGEVEYTISSQNYYFDRFLDGEFSFSKGWYYNPPYNYGDKFLSRGKLTLGTDGKGKISEELDLEKMFKNRADRMSRIIVFDITVKNNQGQSVSSQKSFLLHAGEFYIAATSDKPFVGVNEATNIKVKTTDVNGKEKQVNGITMNVYKIDWIYNKRQEATGGYSYKWEEKKEFIKDFKFNTDNKGNHSQELKLEKEGQYLVEPSAKDGRGNEVFGSYYLYVYGDGHVNIKPSNDTTLDLTSEKTSLKVGEDGRVIIKSPYDKAKALIAVERGKVFDYYIKDIVGNLSEFTFSVRDEFAPNVYVSVLLVSSKPEIKYGNKEFQVNTERKNLNITVKPNKSSYLPGEEVVLDISSKDYSNNGVATEVSVSVVDLSVLALSGNPKQNPMLFFYGGFPLTVSTSSNLKDVLQEIEVKTKGGGGATAASMDKLSEENALSVKKRGDFRESAYWSGQVKTNDSGNAQIKFVLPDNLTKWQAEIVGVSKDTKVGTGYADFTSKKDLMIVPLKPRFAIPGDNFYIGAQIFNQSDSIQKVAITFSGNNLPLDKESADKSVKLGPGKSETVYFRVSVPVDYRNDSVSFTLSGKGQGLEDTVEQAITINQNSTYETSATSGYTTSDSWAEYLYLPNNSILKDRGGLTIKTSATLAVFLSDSLNYMMNYPYGCLEQVGSRLKSIAVVKRGLNLPNIFEKFNLQKIKYNNKEYTPDEIVQIGLSKIYDQQGYDGGFGYWPGGESDYHLTVYLLEVFGDLKKAGYNVNKEALDNAVKYIWQKLTTDTNISNKSSVVISTIYSLENLPSSDTKSQLTGVETYLKTIVDNVSYINDKADNETLSKLASILYVINYSDTATITRINNTLDNRLEIDSRGAFLSESKELNWFAYETAIKNTALYLRFNSLKKSNNPILDKVVRWLLNSKQTNGSWGSTNETTAVIDAFTEYLAWKRETESNFSLDILVNKVKEATIDINSDTVLDQYEKTWPLSAFRFNASNLISFAKTNKNSAPNNFYYDMVLKYYLPADEIAPRDEGFTISRNFYHIDDKENKAPVTIGKVGEILKQHIEITVPKTRRFVAIEDFIPAGMEIVNLDLATEQKSLLLNEMPNTPRPTVIIEDLKIPSDRANTYSTGTATVKEMGSSSLEKYRVFDRTLYPDFKELRDDRAFIFKQTVDPGVYTFDYYVRPLIKGKFNYLPAVVSEMYFPENFGRTDGKYFEIK